LLQLSEGSLQCAALFRQRDGGCGQVSGSACTCLQPVDLALNSSEQLHNLGHLPFESQAIVGHFIVRERGHRRGFCYKHYIDDDITQVRLPQSLPRLCPFGAGVTAEDNHIFDTDLPGGNRRPIRR
jgi:hypothetical protein